MNWTPEQIWRLASSAAASGLAPDGLKVGGKHSPDACFYVMCAGAELGIAPITALRILSLVKGRLTIGAEAMLGLAIRARVRAEWLRADGEVATLRLTREGHAPYEQSFTMADAKAAGLGGDNWRKYPAAMLRARCISAAVRAYCPDVVTGLYTPEEIAGVTGAHDPTDVASIPGPASTPAALPDHGEPHRLTLDGREPVEAARQTRTTEPAAAEAETAHVDDEGREYASAKCARAAAKLRAEGILADVEESFDAPSFAWTEADLVELKAHVERVRARLGTTPVEAK